MHILSPCFHSEKGMDEIMSDFTRSDTHENHECMVKSKWLICCWRKSEQKIKRKEREADWTTSVYIPRSHDPWKHVLTARIKGMKSWVISCSWVYLKITNVVQKVYGQICYWRKKWASQISSERREKSRLYHIGEHALVYVVVVVVVFVFVVVVVIVVAVVVVADVDLWPMSDFT